MISSRLRVSRDRSPDQGIRVHRRERVREAEEVQVAVVECRGIQPREERVDGRQQSEAGSRVQPVAQRSRVPEGGSRRRRQEAADGRRERVAETADGNLARRPHVDVPGPGANQTRVRHICRAHLQRELDLRRRQAGRPLKQQRDRSADHRRRHARAAQLHVGIAAGAGTMKRRIVRREVRTGRFERHDPVARRRDVWLHREVVFGRTSRAVGRDSVVVPFHRAPGVHSADRDGHR